MSPRGIPLQLLIFDWVPVMRFMGEYTATVLAAELPAREVRGHSSAILNPC